MKVQFQNLTRLHGSIQDDLDGAIRRVIDRSAFVSGVEVGAFETAFAAAHGVTAVAGCGSGTDALALALRALGVGPGDGVVVPSMTFVATAEAVVHVGAIPIIADVDPETLLLTQESVDAVRTASTKAIVPVHLYGNVVSHDLLAGWRNDGLVVVEDAAQAHLGRHDGHGVGTVSHAACFSFYPGKNLGALGDGGAVASTDADLIDRVRTLRDHGRRSKYIHDVVGWCSRLDGLQAAVLATKLEHLGEWTDARRQLALAYKRELAGSSVRLVPFEAGSVHHLLVARVEPNRRVAMQAQLADVGVATGIHYPVPLSQQPSLERWWIPAPHAEAAATEVLSLPMDPLMSVEEVVYVCEHLVAVADGASAKEQPRAEAESKDRA